ncbi:MAG: hypothetical protein NZ534_12410, partial [Bacteroidia bacterium]|nr:hypothetical protein [Bacteroidia bacterium]
MRTPISSDSTFGAWAAVFAIDKAVRAAIKSTAVGGGGRMGAARERAKEGATGRGRQRTGDGKAEPIPGSHGPKAVAPIERARPCVGSC